MNTCGKFHWNDRFAKYWAVASCEIGVVAWRTSVRADGQTADTLEMSGNVFSNPIPSHSQWFIRTTIPDPMFSLVLVPIPSHYRWLFPFPLASIPVLLVVYRSDNKWPVNSTMHKQSCYKSSKIDPYTCSVNASSVSWTSTWKPSLTVYDKLRCKNKGPRCLMISYLWVANGKCGVFIPSFSHRAIPIPTPIPVKLA